MILIESKLIDNFDDIEVGDWFIIHIMKGNNPIQANSRVEHIRGDEILLKQNTKKTFSLHYKTAIDGSTLSYTKTPENKSITVEFTKIVVADKNREPKFIITSEETEELEKNKNLKAKLKKTLNYDREETVHKFSELKQFSQFTLHAADNEITEDGEFEVIDGTESVIKFKVDTIIKTIIICQLLSAEGKYRRLFNKYKSEDFYFNMSSKLLNTNYDTGVAIQIYHGKNKTPIILKDVYLMDIEGEDEEPTNNKDKELDDNPEDDVNSFKDLLQNKDLMRLMNNRTAWDKVMGRKAKGLKPLNDLKNSKSISSLYDKDKRVRQKVKFKYIGETITGDTIQLKNGEVYADGFKFNSETIKRNGKRDESLFLKILKSTGASTYQVKVSYRNPSRKITKEINAKIELYK